MSKFYQFLLLLLVFTAIDGHSTPTSHNVTDSNTEHSGEELHEENIWADDQAEQFWVDFGMLASIAVVGWIWAYANESVVHHFSHHINNFEAQIHTHAYFILEVVFSFQKEVTTLGFLGALTFTINELNGWDWYEQEKLI